MISYGFFNAVDGDRTYDAETFNTFFEGLISSNGIFANVDEEFVVKPQAGLQLNVGTGKAIVNNHWVRSDSDIIVQLEPAHALLSRYDMISLIWSPLYRSITISVTSGAPASTPVRPVPQRNLSEAFEIVLAYVSVKPNASVITTGDIEDRRHDSSVCGFITGLVEQVDTSTIYNQYLAQFNELYNAMQIWQASQQNAYESWFATLTGQLQVNTYIERTTANYTITDERYYIQIPEELGYATTDILEVFINGVLYVEGLEYTIEENEVEGGYMVRFKESLQGSQDTTQIITFYCMKSKIGSIVS